jgi:hypothetical protein
MDDLKNWLLEDWLRENPMPNPQALAEALRRRLAADHGDSYDPVKHRSGWEQITAMHDEFDRALADWRRRYIKFRLQHR